MRKTLRYVHLAIGFAIGAYIYSPTLSSHAVFQMFIQFGVFPFLALSGIAMWQHPRVMKLLRRT